MRALGVKWVIKINSKLGMGMKAIKKKRGGLTRRKIKRTTQNKRIILYPSKDGFIPFLLPWLGALRAEGGGALSLANAVKGAKVQRKKQNQLEEKIDNI